MITIRKATDNDIQKIAKMINQTWKISYRGIIPDSVLAKQTYKHHIPHLKNYIAAKNTMVLVAATDSGAIVGMVSGGICREKLKNHDGELYGLYVAPKYQQKNTGKQLFIGFCAWLKQHKFRSMMLWTLKANKLSRNFYEKMGGKVIKERKIEISGKKFNVVAYGWLKLLVYDFKKDSINLVKHNPKWLDKAKLEIAHIKNTLANKLIVDIQHIGSTAIPNIKSKPIIDIMIGVTSLCHKKENLIKPLETIGYVFCKNNPDKNRLFLIKRLPSLSKKRIHHLHISKYNSKTWSQHLFFRDYLIRHPAAAKKYEALKIKLANKYKTNREQYTQKKKIFIANVLSKNL